MIILKELDRYSEDYLRGKLDFQHHQEFIGFKEQLLEKQVLKQVDSDIYTFNYVGAIIYNNSVIFCIPKFVDSENPFLIVEQLFSLFIEYGNREKVDQFDLDIVGALECTQEYSALSVIIFLLRDYLIHGLYTNEKRIYKLNGRNEINWDKTINEIQPIISHNKPFYLNYYTYESTIDEEGFFRQLHKLVINRCSEKLKSLGLTEYVGFQPLELDINQDLFGPPEYLLSRIENELSVQYITRKQLVLKAMYYFISKEWFSPGGINIGLFGTRNFNMVWEKVCSYVLNDQSDIFNDNIDAPEWFSKSGRIHRTAPIKPDIITIEEVKGNKLFVIADAKYYNINLSGNSLRDNPGVGDVVKQYVYQMAFSSFLSSKNFDEIRNVFLFPCDSDMDCDYIGKVSIEFFNNEGLEDIMLIKLPAKTMFENYINYTKQSLFDWIEIGN